MLHGDISCLGETSSWWNLHILDFASNKISGVMHAEMFQNLKGFIIDGTQQQRDILQLSVYGVSRDRLVMQPSPRINNRRNWRAELPLCSQVLPQCSLQPYLIIGGESNSTQIVRPVIQHYAEKSRRSLQISHSSGFTTSFVGNKRLCGFPINKTSIGDVPFQQAEYSVGGIYATAAWGLLVGLGFFL